jgi:hypothetical protein
VADALKSSKNPPFLSIFVWNFVHNAVSLKEVTWERIPHRCWFLGNSRLSDDLQLTESQRGRKNIAVCKKVVSSLQKAREY